MVKGRTKPPSGPRWRRTELSAVAITVMTSDQVVLEDVRVRGRVAEAGDVQQMISRVGRDASDDRGFGHRHGLDQPVAVVDVEDIDFPVGEDVCEMASGRGRATEREPCQRKE